MSELKGKRLLLLGGVQQCCEIIKEAKKMGIVTFVTDNRKDSPAKKIADHAFEVNAIDVDAVVRLCREQRIDGVITGYVDMLLPYCQQICEKLNVPFWGDADNIEMCINKELFKSACEKAGVPVVPWCRATNDDYLDVIGNVEVPVVIKPVDNSGSRGIVKCYDKAELKNCVEQSMSYSKCGVVLIERMMDANKEFSAYYMIHKGHAYLCAMGDRYVEIIDSAIAPVGKGMLYPSILLDEWIEQMDASVQKFFCENNMTDGFVFLQGFYEEGRFYIHEIGYRLNGGYTYDIVQHFSGYHQLHELIRFELTGEMDEAAVKKSNPYFDGLGMIVTISLKPGRISVIEGVSEIEQLPGVLSFHQQHNVGDVLLSHGTTAQVFGYILCGVREKRELDILINSIDDKLVILDEDGNNMRRDLIDPNVIKIGKKDNHNH